MKTTLRVLAICLCFAGGALAGDEDVVVPARVTGYQPKVVLIGPKDSLTAARAISGKVRIMAVFPSTVKASEVEFFFDGKLVGKSSSRPFRADLDVSNVPVGEHILKAVAGDSAGAEAWSASAKARVQASSEGAPEKFGHVEVVPVPSDSPGSNEAGKLADTLSGSAPAGPRVAGQAIDKLYKSLAYEFSINYPSAWKVRDDTAAASKRGNSTFWIVFGDEPIVVNIHARMISPGTDQNQFAKYNPYVGSWTRKIISGRPAFSITTGSAENRSVVHRLIVLDRGRALMLNCVDKSGGSADDSARIFDAMARSLQSFARPAVVKEKRK